MIVSLLKAKLHNVVVTDAKLEYVGSITIDEHLMNAVGLLPNEKVLVVNNNNGSRIETYVIKGKKNSGIICLNGAAAHHFSKGDVAIIMAFALYSSVEANTHKPKVIFPHTVHDIPNLAYHTPEQITKKIIMNHEGAKISKGFYPEHVDEIALQMAFTSDEVADMIVSMGLRLINYTKNS